MVEGYTIPFVTTPFQSKGSSLRNNRSNKEVENIEISIKRLLSIGAIEQCKHKKGEFLSPYFLVTKPNGDFRFVLNLKSLNKFVDTVHFKLEHFKNVKDLLSRNVFMCTVDLKDGSN